jgi:hypothetical protein
MPPVFFNSISITKPHAKIYKRLGFRKGITQLGELHRKETDQYIDEAIKYIQLKGAGLRVSVQKGSNEEIAFLNCIISESKKLAAFLNKSEEIILMGATAGSEIIEGIKSAVENQNITRGVVYDATASEMVDAALSWIMNFFNRELVRENKLTFKKRFSAGYGDLSLEHQKTMCHLLILEKIGVKISDTYMLSPEKSVMAITGIFSPQ